MKIRRLSLLMLAIALVLALGTLPAAAAVADTGELMPLADRVVATGTINVNESLNVRSGPGTGYSKVGTIAAGTLVEIYEFRTVSGTEWARIDMGWISMAYVILGNNPIASGTINVNESLNVRSGPGSSYTKVGTIAGGTHVDIYEIRTVSSTDWGRIDMGWISMDYVILDGGSSATVIASGDWSGGNVLWELTSDGTLTLDGPRTMQGATNGAFPWKNYSSRVTRIVIEDGLTSIAAYAFQDMTNVTSVELSNTIKTIEEGAFRDCTSLKSVTIPASVTTLGNGIFFQCTALAEVKFAPNSGLTTIGESVFSTSGVTAVDIPASVTEIGKAAFYDCDALVSVTFHEGLTTVRDDAFYDCESLRELTIPSTLENIGYDTFRGCPIEKLDLYTNVNFQADFPYNTTLTTVIYHDNMTTVSGMGECDTLVNVTMPDSITTIAGNAFENCDALTAVKWPAKLQTIGNFAFSLTGMTEVVLPDSVTTVGNSAFHGCKNLTSFAAGSGLQTIGKIAFSGCTSLTSVDLGNVTSIGSEVFNGCTALKDIVWSEKLESMGYMAFYECDDLTSVTLPASLRTIDHSAFAFCRSLKEIYFTGDAPTIGAYTFKSVTTTAYYPKGNATWTADVMQNYGGTVTWKPYEEKEEEIPDVTYTTVSVSLEGDIGLNYYVKLSDRIALDETAYMQFTYADQVQTVPMSQAIQGSDGAYRFSCAIPAKRMTDVVTGQMYTADGPVGDPKEYSVARYCVSMKEHVENNNLTGYDSLLALLDAMLNYGGYSQLSFGYNTGDLANASLSDTEKALPANLDASAYAHSISGSEEGIAVYSASLLLESRTTIRFYFTLTGDRTADDFVLTVDGTPASLTQIGSLYYIDVPNVAAKDLDVMHTVVSDGGLTVSYCGLSYVNQILNWSGASEADVNTAKALYLYNQAANTYFGE